MRPAFAFAAMLLFVPFALAAPPANKDIDGFMGRKWGEPLAKLGASEEKDTDYAQRVWFEKAGDAKTFLGTQADSILYGYHSPPGSTTLLLVSAQAELMADPRFCLQLEETLVKAYGPPTEKEDPSGIRGFLSTRKWVCASGAMTLHCGQESTSLEVWEVPDHRGPREEAFAAKERAGAQPGESPVPAKDVGACTEKFFREKVETRKVRAQELGFIWKKLCGAPTDKAPDPSQVHIIWNHESKFSAIPLYGPDCKKADYEHDAKASPPDIRPNDLLVYCPAVSDCTGGVLRVRSFDPLNMTVNVVLYEDSKQQTSTNERFRMSGQKPDMARMYVRPGFMILRPNEEICRE